jgi:phage terminase large subunit
MGVGNLFDVQRDVIYGPNKSEFLFRGLSDQTAESIKSLEGLDVAWIEEAQTISKRSLDILIPTIRKPGSRIIVSMNPELDTDEAYVRFVAEPPPGSAVVQMNWRDNPWFPEVLEAERLHAKATMTEADYENIWEGKTKPAVSGAIYASEVADLLAQGRLCNVPYDANLKVHVIFDLGWNDQMSMILCQKHVSELRVIDYIEENHKTLDWCSAELKKRNWNWGSLWLPHDGAHGDFKTGKSAQQILQEQGWSVEIVPKAPVEQGIRLSRMALPRTYMDKAKADRLLQCLRRYRRGIPATTGEPGQPVHDEWSHGADAYRYLATVAERLTNETFGGTLTYKNLGMA